MPPLAQKAESTIQYTVQGVLELFANKTSYLNSVILKAVIYEGGAFRQVTFLLKPVNFSISV